MKGQLRYGECEIPERFKVKTEHSLELIHERPAGGPISFNIFINLMDIEWKDLKTHIKQHIESEKIRNARWQFENEFYKNIVMNGNEAVLTGYMMTANGGKRAKPFDFCYISLKNNKVLKIQGEASRKETYDHFKKQWEDFYLSFKTEVNQNYKTTFGSFNANFEKMDDVSRTIFYFDEFGDRYRIEFSHRNDLSEAKYISLAEETGANLLKMFSGTVFSIEKKQRVKVDDRDAIYIEILYGRKRMRKGSLYVYGIDPGLEMIIDADEKLFEKYRGDMEHIIRSIKFDQ